MSFCTSIFTRAMGVVFMATLVSAGGYAAETDADQPLVIEQPGPGPNEVGLLFEKDGQQQLVLRQKSELPAVQRDSQATTATEGHAIVNALVNGPTDEEKAAGVSHFLPEGSTLGNVTTELPDTIRIYLDIPAEFVQSNQYNEMFVHEAGEAFIESLHPLGYRQFIFYVKDHATGSYKEIRDFLDQSDLESVQAPQPEAEEAESQVEPRNLPTQTGFVSGALSGKSVVLNQSHGWFDDHDGPQFRWRTQRGRYLEVIEDYGSAMFMNHYVIPLLQNAGARVRPVREPDSQTNMVIVDNADGSPAYQEVGAWDYSTANGFTKKATYTGTTDNPFGLASGTRYANGVTGEPTATATYTATFPADGYYNVYISYSQGTNRTSNAHWQVHHSGGVTDFRIDQKMSGGTWVLLGNFYFEAGASADQRKVVVLNDSGDTAIVSCDAVRFGGGNGSLARRTHGVSGRPRWQEEANNYLQFTGMLASTLMSNDAVDTNDDEQIGWSNRPQYAQWEQTRDGLGSNLVYVGWHTNALSGSTCSGGVETGSSARGMGSYRDVDADANAATEGLTSLVHNSTINNIRAFYQSNWQNRGIVASNNYGECNQANLGSVAGFFFEGLFHDNSADTNAYKDPKFRYIAARGIVQGIIQHWGGTVFPPEPVTNFRVQNIGNGEVRLNWTAGPVRTAPLPYGSAATGFRIYKSSNGYGFDNGIDVANVNEHVLTLTPGETTFLRIAARNNGGISIPSETLAVRVPLAGSPTVLIVNGYTRNDRFLGPTVSSSGIGGCSTPGSPANTYRNFDPREFQSFNYTVQHADAIEAAGGYGIDSCSKDAINLTNVALTSYPMVFWIGGQQAEADTADGVDDQSFKPAERTEIDLFLKAGGRLFLSGSELAWDLGRSGVSADKSTFLSNNLMAGYSADDSNTNFAAGGGGIFSGISSFAFDNGSGSTYEVRFPDVITPANGSTACLNYSGGSGGTAGIQYHGYVGDSTNLTKIVFLGFGFETITSEAVRNDIMARSIEWFNNTAVEEWDKF